MAMQVVDMDEVVQIEEKIYGHPWTRGNFLDSLFSGYQTLPVRDPSGRLRGYFLLLEVRVSNLRALHVYKRYGFVEIGRRKNYYPVDQHTREDAIVMSLPL